MASLAQVVAAVAGGALLAIATMLVFKVRDLQHQADEERQIETAVRATVAGVETFRQQARAVEVHSKAHLRMLVDADRGTLNAVARPRGPQRPRAGHPTEPSTTRADRSGPVHSR